MTTQACRIQRFARTTLNTLIMVACLGSAFSALAQAAPTAATDWRSCSPGQPCANPYPVKVVIVAMFERGEDEGDAPGEFQFWKERLDLDERVAFPQGYHDLFLNPQTGVLGTVTGIGTIHSAGTTMALGLDQRFDLSQAYWLVAGIAGIDPEDASIGSAAWSAWLIDADLAHEIDPREIPDDWNYGYFARHTKFPFDPKRPKSRGEAHHVNESLRDWAWQLTRDLKLPDLDGLAASRMRYTDHPNAQKPPFVLRGGHIAGMTFWHGKLMNDWANRWVSYWSDGATDFVTSAMEDTGTYQSITYLDRIGRVDKDRFLVLRAGSNYTMPPPGVTAADNLLKENQGYVGMIASLESLYLVGNKVVQELLRNWDRWSTTIPAATPPATP